MNMSVINVEDFSINEKLCISLVDKINYNNIDINILKKNFIDDINFIVKKYNVTRTGFIFLVDYSKIDFKNFSISRAKTIITLMMDNFPNKLYKCIFYNTNNTLNTFVKLIKVFLDKITAEKLICDKEISKSIVEMKQTLVLS